MLSFSINTYSLSTSANLSHAFTYFDFVLMNMQFDTGGDAFKGFPAVDYNTLIP